jgi:hypothetical protein
MQQYYFGQGGGHLGAKAAKIARKHGAELVNAHDPGCRCGRGCPPRRECPATARHWFAGPNRGEPFNAALAKAVLTKLEASGLIDETGYPASDACPRRLSRGRIQEEHEP